MLKQSGWGLWVARMGCGLILLTGGACGGDDTDDTASNIKGNTGGKAAGEAGRGGSSASASSAGRGGSAAGRGGTLPRTQQPAASDAYRCQPKPEDKRGFGSDGARCCAGFGSCTPAAGLAGASGLPRDTCSAESELVCLPNEPPKTEEADGGTSSGFAHCRVKFPGAPADFPDYEGRCMASCFGLKSPIAARLSVATCEQGQLCTPCYDPLTGDSTGSCELRGDAPTEPGPKGFAECAGGLGYCVPAFAAGMFAGDLRQLTCAQGELCGPKNKVADPSACFDQCESAGFGPGACVPEFLASNFSSFLAPTTCTDGNLCAPCAILGQRTGVCD